MSQTNFSTAPVFESSIGYDRVTKDYAIYVNGELIGFAANYRDAEAKRTAYLAERMEDERSSDPPSDPLPTDFPGEDIDGVPQPRVVA